jgi:hypothetical protein
LVRPLDEIVNTKVFVIGLRLRPPDANEEDKNRGCEPESFHAPKMPEPKAFGNRRADANAVVVGGDEIISDQHVAALEIFDFGKPETLARSPGVE